MNSSIGGSGNDTLYGDGGNDAILGGDGNDQIEGGQAMMGSSAEPTMIVIFGFR